MEVHMTFYSPEFIFIFLPCFVVLYAMMRGKAKNALLFLGSLVFYWFASGKAILPVGILVTIILVNYTIGLIIGISGANGKRIALSVGFVLDSVILLSPKLFEILTASLPESPAISIIAPVGFSFYMFKNMSYIRQVYDGRVKAESSFLALGAYVSLFSQVLSGPIQTYADFKRELNESRVTLAGVNSGIYEFIIGLSLKILLADRIIRVWNAGLYGINSIGVDSISTPLAWLGFLSFPLYLYFEFYGYSLMSRGVGRMLGYETPDNFLFPYMSRSVGEFWRRWHMTLGEWFKENVYFPLGGNRRGMPRTLLNLTAVWVLTGVWHALCFDGNGINFMLWAGFLLLFILLERVGALKFVTESRVLSHIYLPIVILFSWVLFNTNLTTFGDLASYLGRLFPFFGEIPEYINSEDVLVHLKDVGAYMAIGIVFLTPLPRRIYEKICQVKPLAVTLMLVLFWLSVYLIFCEGANPMVY